MSGSSNTGNNFCSNCGQKIAQENNFCSKCGFRLQFSSPKKINDFHDEKLVEHNEKMQSEEPLMNKTLFKEYGEIMVKTVSKKSNLKKTAAWYMTMPAMPSDFVKTLDDVERKFYKGDIVLKQNQISCNGNVFPLKNILKIKKMGTISKGITLSFERTDDKNRYKIDVEIKTKSLERLHTILESIKKSQH